MTIDDEANEAPETTVGESVADEQGNPAPEPGEEDSTPENGTQDTEKDNREIRYRKRAQAAEEQLESSQALVATLQDTLTAHIVEQTGLNPELLDLSPDKPWLTESGEVDTDILRKTLNDTADRLQVKKPARRMAPDSTQGIMGNQSPDTFTMQQLTNAIRH